MIWVIMILIITVFQQWLQRVKGTVIAAADQRNTHWSDWGNIDTVVRRSTDNGLTWEDPIDVID